MNTSRTREKLTEIGWQNWTADAACAGTEKPETWFPDPGNEDEMHAAIDVCHRCPVMVECGQYADATKAGGVWGGTWRPYAGHYIPLNVIEIAPGRNLTDRERLERLSVIENYGSPTAAARVLNCSERPLYSAVRWGRALGYWHHGALTETGRHALEVLAVYQVTGAEHDATLSESGT